MSKFEQVVAIRRESIADKLKQGFTEINGTEETKQEQFDSFFKPEEIVIGSRHWIENDERFLQLIPSCVFKKPDGSVFVYRRAKGTGENRLLGKTSCNIGGHLNLVDCEMIRLQDRYTNTIDVVSSVWDGIFREIEEELDVSLDDITVLNYSEMLNEFKGIIYDDTNTVGRVHIGLLFVFDVEQDVDFNLNQSEGLKYGGWYDPNTILHHDDIDACDLENWARIVLESLV